MLAAGRAMSFLKALAKQARAQLEGFAVQYCGRDEVVAPGTDAVFLVAQDEAEFRCRRAI